MANAVVLVTDAGLFPAAVFLARRLSALNRRPDTDIVIVTDAAAETLRGRALLSGIRLWLVEDFAAEVADMPAAAGKAAAFYRLLLPEVLADQYERMLYLDVDTYPVDGLIFDLFDLPIGQSGVAACRDLFIEHTNWSTVKDYLLRTGMSGVPYFNSGLMLVQLEAVLRNGVAALAVERAQAGEVRGYLDQDALNQALIGTWTELSPRFNYFFYLLGDDEVRSAFPPSVIHFAGDWKLWTHPPATAVTGQRKEFEAFLAASPWPRFLSNPRFRHSVHGHLPPGSAVRAPSVGLAGMGLDEAALRRFLASARFADVEAGIGR